MLGIVRLQVSDNIRRIGEMKQSHHLSMVTVDIVSHWILPSNSAEITPFIIWILH